MKSILFFLLVMLATFSLAQKRMQSISSTNYDDGIAYSYDSTAFSYLNVNGSMLTYKPVFGYSKDNLMYSFHYGPSNFKADGYDQFSGSPSPVSLSFQSNSTYIGNQLIEKIEGSYKYQYFYDVNDNIILYKTYINTGTWEIQDSVLQTFNSSHQLLTKRNYSTLFSSNLELLYIDSIDYDPIDGKIVEHRGFYYDNVTVQIIPSYKKEFHHNLGNEIDYVDGYQYSNVTDGLEWVDRLNYNLINGSPVSILKFVVSNGVLQNLPSEESYYAYDANNKVTQFLYIHQGDSSFVVNYTYLDENFLSTQEGKFYNDPLDPLHSFKIQYRYESTLDLENLVQIQGVLFPNPAKEKLEVQVDGEILSLEVFNLQGQLLIQQNAKIIDVNELSSGTYIVKGKSSEGTFKEKFIKE